MNQERPEPRWLHRSMVLAIHADQVRQHGGNSGLRDRNLLESALSRAQNRWHYEPTTDTHSLAAAYGFGIAKNHPFIDGNKRTAFMAMFVFLGLNGFLLVASETEVVELMVDVASGKLGEEALGDWLRDHSQTK